LSLHFWGCISNVFGKTRKEGFGIYVLVFGFRNSFKSCIRRPTLRKRKSKLFQDGSLDIVVEKRIHEFPKIRFFIRLSKFYLGLAENKQISSFDRGLKSLRSLDELWI
jgi:hypothetical protein